MGERPEDAGARGWNDEAGEPHVAVAEAVAALPQERRVVVVLHYRLDYTAREIADVLGLPIGTISSRLSRARVELRDAIKEEENAA